MTELDFDNPQPPSETRNPAPRVESRAVEPREEHSRRDRMVDVKALSSVAGAPGMARRDFLHGALAVAGVPPLCCTSTLLPARSVKFENDRISIDLDSVPELRRSGAAFAVADAERKLNLLIVHAAHNRYVALDRSCTHGGAQCTYNNRRHTLQCTSLNHAEYDLNGTLLHGRTHGNLKSYETQAVRSTLVILLGQKD